jgi:GTP-binding protein
MASPLQLSFLRSASAHTQLDESVSEICMVGRSNVGKSSLINALANRNKLAKTSKTPGATQLINIYEYGDEDSGRWLVDLPGYGFAKMPKNKQRQMATMINDYMLEREPLTHAVVLIDANVGPTDLDLQTLDWLRDIELDFVVVGTKVDKIKSGQRSKKQKKAAEKLGLRSGDIRWVSAEKGTGIPELRAAIAGLLHVTNLPTE